MTPLQLKIGQLGAIPLVPLSENADLGEAAGAAVVALLAGMRAVVPPTTDGPRLAASGILTHKLDGGPITVWGAGAASRPGTAELIVCATRGPITRELLGGPDVFGDPAWLLPWFYRPALAQTWELGLVLAPGQAMPIGLPDWVCAIPGDAPHTPEALLTRIDAMLACRRIASAIAGALILAEAYGIACLPLLVARDGNGLKRLATTEAALGLAVADTYAGLRRSAVPAFLHPYDTAADMDRLAAAIDRAWSPAWLREDDLIEAFPLPCAPSLPREGILLFERPLVAMAVQPDTLAPVGPPNRATPALNVHPSACLQEWVDENGVVPMAWAATSEQSPHPNLGDALSALIVSAMTGLKLQRRNFDDQGERLVAVGTIGHTQKNGAVHLWGTAVDPTRNAFDPSLGRFAVPPETRLTVHATRGRNTAAHLRNAGVSCPEIYGDPVWFLPRLAGHRPVIPRYELGVILHITELDGVTPEAAVLAAYKRYRIPPPLADAIKLITTYTEQGTEALLAKVDEIRSCRRIVSTSFHGLVIPEAFGIPNMWFSTHPGGAMMADVADLGVPMDHRVRDWYSGTNLRRVPIFGTQRHLPTRWDQVIRWLDTAWEPLQTNAAGLFDAFPLRKSVHFDATCWPLDPALFDEACY